MILRRIEKDEMYAVRIKETSQNVEVVPIVLVLLIFHTRREMHIKQRKIERI